MQLSALVIPVPYAAVYTNGKDNSRQLFYIFGPKYTQKFFTSTHACYSIRLESLFRDYFVIQ